MIPSVQILVCGAPPGPVLNRETPPAASVSTHSVLVARKRAPDGHQEPPAQTTTAVQ